ncbi:unnamed protein product [Effrenium voratum]|nr:unnamed protein product [Effrenium voratum]
MVIVDVCAACVLCALPRSFSAAVGALQQPLLLSVLEEPEEFIPQLQQLIHKELKLRSPKKGFEPKRPERKTAPKAAPKASPRITRSMSAAAQREGKDAAFRSSSLPAYRPPAQPPQRPEPPRPLQPPQQAKQAKQAQIPKPKGVWEKAAEVARSMLTLRSGARAASANSHAATQEAAAGSMQASEPKPKSEPRKAADKEGDSMSAVHRKDMASQNILRPAEAGCISTFEAKPKSELRKADAALQVTRSVSAETQRMSKDMAHSRIARACQPQPTFASTVKSQPEKAVDKASPHVTRSKSAEPQKQARNIGTFQRSGSAPVYRPTSDSDKPEVASVPSEPKPKSEPRKADEAPRFNQRMSAEAQKEGKDTSTFCAPSTPMRHAHPAKEMTLTQALSLANEATELGVMHPTSLRQLCIQRGVSSEGLRKDLIQRLLIDRMSSFSSFSCAPSPSFASPSTPSRKQLQEACRGVPPNGKELKEATCRGEGANLTEAEADARPEADPKKRPLAQRSKSCDGGARKRIREKSPAPSLRSASPDPLRPAKRVRGKSPDPNWQRAHQNTPRQNTQGTQGTQGTPTKDQGVPTSPQPKTPVSAVGRAAVKSLLTLRPEQLEAECLKMGISPRPSAHAMACRLAAVRLQSLTPSSSTEVLSPIPSTTPKRKASLVPVQTPPTVASQAGSEAGGPLLRRGRSPSHPVEASAPDARRGRSPRTPRTGGTGLTTRTRSQSVTRSAGARPAAWVASLLCKAPGASPQAKTPPSTPQRRTTQRSPGTATGDKVRRDSMLRSLSRPRENFARSPGQASRATQACHASTRSKGLPCKKPGSSRPSGALFHYCHLHVAAWREHER